MKWTFGKKRPSDKTRDPVVSEFFSADAIKDAGEALVREGIQNSLDARRPDASVVSVRVYVSGQTAALKAHSVHRWFVGAWPHYRANGNGLKPGDVSESVPCRFLAFEDFGTTGLTGDRRQYEEKPGIDNPFFYFFRAEAKTAKYGDARGRWGIGKQVFPRASRAQTFFGYSETDEGGFLMGGAILKHHRVGTEYFKPDGFWGNVETVDGDEFTTPVSEKEVLERFREDFGLRRMPGDRGLSIVVPWLDDIGDGGENGAFARSALVFAILEGYFVPILEGRLEATVEDESGSFHISRTTYRDVLAHLRSASGRVAAADVDRLEALLQLAEKVQSKHYVAFELGPCPSSKAAWTDGMLDESNTATMRDALKTGQAIGVKARLTVRPKGGIESEDCFMCFIERDERLSGRACHVREDLIISDVKSPKIPGYACIVRVDHGSLATLLGDSENPAHTEWQPSSRNFKDKYTLGGLTIGFVSTFPAELLKRVHASSRELDRTLLVDLFSDSGPSEASGETRTRGAKKAGETGVPIEPPPPQLPSHRVHQVESGFSVTSEAGRLPVGTEMEVVAAYETSKGNPFKTYDINDFEFTDSTMAVAVTGATVLQCERNRLLVKLLGADLEVRVTGFDVNRDVQVKTAVRASDGPGEAVDVAVGTQE